MTHADTPIGPRAVPLRGGVAPCPAPEELARFVDGVLAAEARDRLVLHLASCDDCRDIVVMAAEMPAPVPASTAAAMAAAPAAHRPGIGWRAMAALAVAATLVFAVYVRRDTPGDGTPPVDAWQAIDAAQGRSRLNEARLALVTRHRPFAGPTRAGASPAMSFGAEAVAVRLAEAVAAADATARVDAEHAAAVAALIAGRPADAVARLDRLVADAAPTPMRLSDLAAAHLALAVVESRMHWAAALDAADAALRLAPAFPPARFNRALALEGLGRAADARAAWQVVAADASDDPAWRDEAARHLTRLSP